MTELELLKKKNEELESRVETLEQLMEEALKILKTSLEKQALINNKVLETVTNAVIRH